MLNWVEWVLIGGMGLCLLAMFVTASVALVTTKINRYTVIFMLFWLGSGWGVWVMSNVLFFGGELH